MTSKTDLIEKFQSILSEDISQWTYKKERVFGDDKIQLYSKSVNQVGEPLAKSELYLRVQAVVKDVSPKVAYETMSDCEKRQKWDPRMQQVKKISQVDNEVTQYYVVQSAIPFIATRDVVCRQQLMPNHPE